MMYKILMISFFALGHIIRVMATILALTIIALSIAYLLPDYYKSIVMLKFSVLTSLSSIFFAYVMYKVGQKFIKISKVNHVK